MAATLLDGKALSETILAEVRQEIPPLAERLGRPPGLVVILVGNSAASRVYVTNKVRTARELGLYSVLEELPADTPAAELSARVAAHNADPGIDGILLQEPLPAPLDSSRHLQEIDPAKDVDGFHPVNVGRLWAGLPGLVPCTPLGVIELLLRAGVATRGAHAVVIGRSNIVGKPMAALLSRRAPGGDATVTLCHSRTRDLPALCRQADILVAATGRPQMVRGDWIKPGATVIDVGINRIEAPETKRGFRLVGDVAFAEAREVAGAITPVPGGVGPMTIAMLMRNTVTAARLRAGI